MITVQEAEAILFAHLLQWTEEEVALEEAQDRCLREAVYADRDFPPFARVSMDGIAIAFAAWEAGRRTFTVLGQVPAGAPPPSLRGLDTCWEVATGGVLPQGADTVVPYEQVRCADGEAVVLSQEVRLGQNVHPQGKDRRAGDVLLEVGTWLGPAQIALLATVGKHRVRVIRRPKIAVVATGDELVAVEEAPKPWQIRLSNPWAIAALLAPRFSVAERRHCPDDLSALRSTLLPLLCENEVVILTGGISAGKRDYVPQVLREGGAEIFFDKVAQRPGKPFLFAQTPSGTAIFALPGNPVSAFMCVVRYVLPWLQRAVGAPSSPPQWALLSEPLEFKPNLTWFVPVSTTHRDGALWAHPRPGNGSGDLANLHEATAFLEMPRERDCFAAGEVFRLWPYS